MSLRDKINKEKLPGHVAIIMDGNGRWAKLKGKKRIYGHKNGVTAVRETTEAAAELGIKYLTLYAFSTENWNRPKDEISALMSLLVSTLNTETKTLTDNNIRLLAIGDLDRIPEKVCRKVTETIEKTAGNTGMSLILALSYSSRWEILNAVKKITENALDNKLSVNDINNELFTKYLTTCGIPDPELVIRTSGEYRISNFLLWQIAYAELYFSDKLWPDYTKEDLYEAVLSFQHRERRFGKISEQLVQPEIICGEDD
ncbi:MAG: isoprenyl transferase [Bacteroidales bacterium]|nr:MAG: isoprenyl transferase [Bacteroidales bacterium]